MKIEDAIPHRPPFLLVDEIVSVQESAIKTRKKFDPTEPFFTGHFPAFPIVPGVLVCEAIAQTGAILLAHLKDADMKGKLPVLTRLNNGKFKQMVRPGDVLEIDVKVIERMATTFFLQGTARVNGKVAVSCDFSCTAVEMAGDSKSTVTSDK